MVCYSTAVIPARVTRLRKLALGAFKSGFDLLFQPFCLETGPSLFDEIADLSQAAVTVFAFPDSQCNHLGVCIWWIESHPAIFFFVLDVAFQGLLVVGSSVS